MERRFRTKITWIVVLVVCIVASLGYLTWLRRSMDTTAAVASASPSATAGSTGTAAASADASASSLSESTASAGTEETAAATATPTATPTAEAVDIDSVDSITKLLNRTYTVAEDYVPSDLVTVNVTSNNEQQLRQEAADALEEMFAAASADGVELMLVSGYRSYKEQLSLWYTYEQRYGRSYALRMDDIPGASEHQLGLAADLGLATRSCELNGCFATTDAYTWLQEHAHEYGFIERYPYGKEDVTGVMYSPWHWRYVGVTEATGIWNCDGWTMEEYYGRTE